MHINAAPPTAPAKPDFPAATPAGQAGVLGQPIARHLNATTAAFHDALTVGQAVAQLRARPPGDGIVYFYVTDAAGRLGGVVPTRTLLLADPAQPLTAVMVRDLVTVPATATVLEACEVLVRHKLLALPVVDADRKLLGVVDVQLYTDELAELHRADQRDDLFQRIGVHATGATAQSPWAAFRGRFPWLSVNLAGGLIAAVLTSLFEATLNRVVALALFIPVVLNLAESVSAQSVSLALHVMRGQRPTWKSAWPAVRGEALTGLLLGVAAGAIVGLAALTWQRNVRLALALIGGIGGGVACSAVFGATVPVVLRLLRLDPRIAAGPVALALADIVTIFVYFALAHALLG